MKVPLILKNWKNNRWKQNVYYLVFTDRGIGTNVEGNRGKTVFAFHSKN